MDHLKAKQFQQTPELPPRGEVANIGQDEMLELHPAVLQPLAEATTTLTEQRLLAVVGDRTRFGVVDATIGGRRFMCLTRFGADGGVYAGRLSNYSGDNTLYVGAVYPSNQGSSREAEGVNFSVRPADDGVIITNKGEQPLACELGRPTEAQSINDPLSAKVAHKGLKRAFGWLKRRAGRAGSEQSDGRQPWSLSDEELQGLLQEWDAVDTIRGSVEFLVRSWAVDDLLNYLRQGWASEGQQEVVLYGTHHGRPAVANVVTKSDYEMVQQRLFMADLLGRDPATAEKFIKDNIAGLHITRSSTLGSMLTFEANPKLLSAARAHKSESAIMFTGGDNFTRGSLLQDSIAFVKITKDYVSRALQIYGGGPSRRRSVNDLQRDSDKLVQLADSDLVESEWQREKIGAMVTGLDKAIAAIQKDPDSAFAQLTLDDFPIAFGISAEAVSKKDHTSTAEEVFMTGDEYTGEFRPIRSEMPLAELPVIVVPEAKVGLIKQLLRSRSLTNEVVSFESVLGQAMPGYGSE